MTSEAIDQLSPLAAEVRAHNPDRYLSTLFASPAHRASLFALYAFDHEIARVQTIVREPIAGLIRLQWWHDVINGFERGDKVAHPVVPALQRAVADGGLDPAYLKRAIDGRRRSFEDHETFDRHALERYLLDIGGSIACAAAGLLGVDEPEMLTLADRAGMVAAAWEEMSTADHKAWSPLSSVEAECHDIALWARNELASARRRKPPIERSALPAFFPITLAAVRLSDPARYKRQPTLSSAVPRLTWCWLRGRF